MKIQNSFSDTFYMKSFRLPAVFLFSAFLAVMPSLTQDLAALEGKIYETGKASWYGGKFQGRQTASGEIFDTNLMTAAHKTLPFGSLVKVTNLENGKTVVVKINDRGPFVEGRIIDLSRAAAEEIGMVGAGVADVSLEILSREIPQYSGPSGTVTVQVGAFKNRENAEKTKEYLKRRGLLPDIQQSEGGIFRIVFNAVPEPDLEGMLNKLKHLGYPNPLVKKNF